MAATRASLGGVAAGDETVAEGLQPRVLSDGSEDGHPELDPQRRRVASALVCPNARRGGRRQKDRELRRGLERVEVAELREETGGRRFDDAGDGEEVRTDVVLVELSLMPLS